MDTAAFRTTLSGLFSVKTRMARSIWIVAALVGIVCIVALLIAPLVDPPATSLLSDASQLLMLCWLITAAAWVFFLARARDPHHIRPIGVPAQSPANQPVRHPSSLTLVLRR
jgi:hypothetical protein